MALPVVIVTGFLGCGKTSFLRKLLPLCGDANLRPALIINEVGDVDVDGELLADMYSEQVRLVGGCVCCTLQTQLSDTIYDVLERKACDVIIIECSGLSNPLDVVNALSAPALLQEVAVSHIICLIDAVRAPRMLKAAELAKSQVSSADILIINKADAVEQSCRPEVESIINGLNCESPKCWTSYGDIGEGKLSAILADSVPVKCSCGCNHDHNHDHHHQHSHALPASFCTVAIALPEKVNKAGLSKLLDSLPANVIRAKGFANVDGEGWNIIHKVYDSSDIIPFNGKAPGIGAVLVCIGQHLSADEIKAISNQALSAN